MNLATLHDCFAERRTEFSVWQRSEFDSVSRLEWDAVVVGAGPAGAMAARELARMDAAVLLVDKKPIPRSKVCGACINGHALAVLGRVGLASIVHELGAVPLEQFQIWNGAHGLRVPLPGGVAVSRAGFDTALAEAAVAAGVRFLTETTAIVGDACDEFRNVELRRDRQSARVRARVVLVADGLGHPSLARHGEFRSVRAVDSRIGCGCVLAPAPARFESGVIYMAVGRRGYLGMVRTEDGALNVAAAIDPRLVSECAGLGEAAGVVLAESGAPDPPSLAGERWRGTPMLAQRPRSVAGRRIFVLGDAAGYVEPFTGQGIAAAVESGVAVAPLARRAADAWNDGLAAEWSDVHRRRIARPQIVSRAFAWALRHPLLVRTGVQLFSFVPKLAEPLVGWLNAPPGSYLLGTGGKDESPYSKGRGCS